MELEGKVALITGAGRNIGKAIALAIAQKGGNLVLITRKNWKGLSEVTQEVSASGVRALPFLADVTNTQVIKEVIQKAEAEFGKIDILVNNAVDRGERPNVPFLEMTAQQWETALDINLTGPFNCAQAVLPGMISRKWGRIINFSGIAALKGSTGRAAVHTAKAGIIGFTKCLAHEFGNSNITVNAIAPGVIDVIRPWSESEPSRSAAATQAPIKREGRPEEVASLVAYLCTENAGYITGQVISVNGGAYM